MTMRLTVLLTLLWLLTLCVSVSAQNSYRLGPEDVITVTVLKHPEFSGDFYISPSGVIDILGIGKVSVTGRTIDEVTREVTQRFSARLLAPEVSIAVRTPRQQRMYVLGAVRTPGIFDLKEGWRITEALAAAGGLAAPSEDCTATLLRAASGVQQKISITSALASKPESNLILAPGDVLTIEQVELLPIYVTGAVKSPGMYELRAGSGAIEALAKAGGLSLPENEVRVALMRNGKTVTTLSPHQPETVLMQRGDILAVEPLRTVRVMVTGSVKSPGLYDLKQGEGAVAAITLAGGAMENAALSRVKIVRGTGTTEMVDLGQAFRDGKHSQNITLSSGDLVIVPESTSGIVVLGYVGAPGFYPIRDGKPMGLSEAIGLAKGTDNKRGGIHEVAILRTTADGKQNRMIVDLGKFMKTGDSKYNPDIQSGDVVFVPETRRPDWNFIFQTISSTASVAYLLRDF